MTPDIEAASSAAEVRCQQCGNRLAEGQDREQTDDGIFCRPCYEQLTEQVRRAYSAQEQDINYPMALLGGLAGGALGVLVWWGFTVVTNYALGLVAVVIGFAVGKGVVLLSGHKRSQKLQILSVAIATASFFYASYLVNRTLILRVAADDGETGVLPWIPTPELFYEVVRISFGIMDLVFLAFVVYEAWKIPAPVNLRT